MIVRAITLVGANAKVRIEKHPLVERVFFSRVDPPERYSSGGKIRRALPCVRPDRTGSTEQSYSSKTYSSKTYPRLLGGVLPARNLLEDLLFTDQCLIHDGPEVGCGRDVPSLLHLAGDIRHRHGLAVEHLCQ